MCGVLFVCCLMSVLCLLVFVVWLFASPSCVACCSFVGICRVLHVDCSLLVVVCCKLFVVCPSLCSLLCVMCCCLFDVACRLLFDVVCCLWYVAC